MSLTEQVFHGRLNLAAAQLGKEDITRVDELLELFAHPLLLGAMLEADIAGFLKSYAQAEIAGGEQKNEFVRDVYGKMSDEIVNKPLTGSGITLADLVRLTRYAINEKKWSFSHRPEHPPDNLPLAE